MRENYRALIQAWRLPLGTQSFVGGQVSQRNYAPLVGGITASQRCPRPNPLEPVSVLPYMKKDMLQMELRILR